MGWDQAHWYDGLTALDKTGFSGYRSDLGAEFGILFLDRRRLRGVWEIRLGRLCPFSKGFRLGSGGLGSGWLPGRSDLARIGRQN